VGTFSSSGASACTACPGGQYQVESKESSLGKPYVRPSTSPRPPSPTPTHHLLLLLRAYFYSSRETRPHAGIHWAIVVRGLFCGLLLYIRQLEHGYLWQGHLLRSRRVELHQLQRRPVAGFHYPIELRCMLRRQLLCDHRPLGGDRDVRGGTIRGNSSFDLHELQRGYFSKLDRAGFVQRVPFRPGTEVKSFNSMSLETFKSAVTPGPAIIFLLYFFSNVASPTRNELLIFFIRAHLLSLRTFSTAPRRVPLRARPAPAAATALPRAFRLTPHARSALIQRSAPRAARPAARALTRTPRPRPRAQAARQANTKVCDGASVKIIPPGKTMSCTKRQDVARPHNMQCAASSLACVCRYHWPSSLPDLPRGLPVRAWQLQRNNLQQRHLLRSLRVELQQLQRRPLSSVERPVELCRLCRGQLLCDHGPIGGDQPLCQRPVQREWRLRLHSLCFWLVQWISRRLELRDVPEWPTPIQHRRVKLYRVWRGHLPSLQRCHNSRELLLLQQRALLKLGRQRVFAVQFGPLHGLCGRQRLRRVPRRELLRVGRPFGVHGLCRRHILGCR
jgi:hypothetical protein